MASWYLEKLLPYYPPVLPRNMCLVRHFHFSVLAPKKSTIWGGIGLFPVAFAAPASLGCFLSLTFFHPQLLERGYHRAKADLDLAT